MPKRRPEKMSFEEHSNVALVLRQMKNRMIKLTILFQQRYGLSAKEAKMIERWCGPNGNMNRLLSELDERIVREYRGTEHDVGNDLISVYFGGERDEKYGDPERESSWFRSYENFLKEIQK